MNLKTIFINYQTCTEIVFPSSDRGYSFGIPPSTKKIPIGDHSITTIGMQGGRLPKTPAFDAGTGRDIGGKNVPESPLARVQREEQQRKRFKTETKIIKVPYISRDVNEPYAAFEKVVFRPDGQVETKVRSMWRFPEYPYVAYIYNGTSPRLAIKIGMDSDFTTLRRGIPLYLSVPVDSEKAKFREWIFSDEGEQHGEDPRRGRDLKKIRKIQDLKRKNAEVAKKMKEKIEKEIRAELR